MIKDQEDSPETVGAQGGMLGDGVDAVCTTYVRVMLNPKLKR